MDEERSGAGELFVSWERRMLPWIKYEVVVDGRVMSSLGYRRPASISLPAGAHDVVLRHRKFKSRPVAIQIAQRGRTVLFGAVRQPPPGLMFFEVWRWSKENGTWLGTEPTPPKPAASFSAPRTALMFAIVVLFSISAAKAASRGDGARLAVNLVFVIGGFSVVAHELMAYRRTKRPSRG